MDSALQTSEFNVDIQMFNAVFISTGHEKNSIILGSL